MKITMLTIATLLAATASQVDAGNLKFYPGIMCQPAELYEVASETGFIVGESGSVIVPDA